MHPDLRLAGALPPLDAPHHARADEWTRWREGVVIASDVGQGGGSVVDVGLDLPAIVDLPLRAGARVTLAMGASRPDKLAPPPAAMALASAAPRGGLPATLARPGAPRDEGGLYWGYTVRLARSLAEVVTGSPHGRVAGGAGYDLTIGTSERGVDAREAVPRALRGVRGGTEVSQQQQSRTKHLPHGPPPFQHALVVFGGPAGLEAADAGAPSMFDVWVNTCPGQGSRTIRTEEAVLVSLAALQPALTAARSVGGGFV
jgi:predicted SPOUT superfamily RNA methylase MTH1